MVQWAHCPKCGHNNRWRDDSLNEGHRICECGYHTMNPEEYFEPAPLPPLESEPITRRERLVVAVMNSTFHYRGKITPAELAALIMETVYQLESRMDSKEYKHG